jgi:hypothetical protein
MHELKFLVLAAIAGTGSTAVLPKAESQVSVNIGLAPDCLYGDYDVVPYDCAPAGTTPTTNARPHSADLRVPAGACRGTPGGLSVVPDGII